MELDQRVYVIYHSFEWYILVESGWLTQTVDNNIAIMIRREVD